MARQRMPSFPHRLHYVPYNGQIPDDWADTPDEWAESVAMAPAIELVTDMLVGTIDPSSGYRVWGAPQYDLTYARGLVERLSREHQAEDRVQLARRHMPLGTVEAMVGLVAEKSAIIEEIQRLSSFIGRVVSETRKLILFPLAYLDAETTLSLGEGGVLGRIVLEQMVDGEEGITVGPEGTLAGHRDYLDWAAEFKDRLCDAVRKRAKDGQFRQDISTDPAEWAWEWVVRALAQRNGGVRGAVEQAARLFVRLRAIDTVLTPSLLKQAPEGRRPANWVEDRGAVRWEGTVLIDFGCVLDALGSKMPDSPGATKIVRALMKGDAPLIRTSFPLTLVENAISEARKRKQVRARDPISEARQEIWAREADQIRLRLEEMRDQVPWTRAQ